MLHPFAEDTKDLTISELTDKISDLSQKYFRTSNPKYNTPNTDFY